MATTPFSDFYPAIRVAIGDIGTFERVSDAKLAGALRLALWAMPESYDETSAGSATITPEVTDKNDKALICMEAALQLLAPRGDAQSVRTAALSWSRRGLWNTVGELKEHIYALRNMADGGLSLDTTITQYQEAGDRLEEALNRSTV